MPQSCAPRHDHANSSSLEHLKHPPIFRDLRFHLFLKFRMLGNHPADRFPLNAMDRPRDRLPVLLIFPCRTVLFEQLQQILQRVRATKRHDDDVPSKVLFHLHPPAFFQERPANYFHCDARRNSSFVRFARESGHPVPPASLERNCVPRTQPETSASALTRRSGEDQRW